MHVVALTHEFIRAAAESGMSEDEIENLVDYLAGNPMAGDEIVGTGGCRKVRVAGRGKGKSGGYRTITFYSGKERPLYLLNVCSLFFLKATAPTFQSRNVMHCVN
jgi:hypothetical protein